MTTLFARRKTAMRHHIPIRLPCLALCVTMTLGCFTYRVDAPNVTPVEVSSTISTGLKSMASHAVK